MRTPLHDLFAGWQADFAEQDGVELPLRCGGVGAEYEAARDGVALADGGDRGWIEMSGPDAPAFLHRLLSSDVLALGEGGGQFSALLDGRGKWLADILLFRFDTGEPAGLGLDLPAVRAGVVHEALDRMHFAEKLAWDAPGHARLLVLGAGAETAVRALGLPLPAASPAGASEAGGLRVLRRPDRGVPCLELLGPAPLVAVHAAALRGAGAVPTGLVVLDILRVEAFEPRFGADFDGEVSLPESNEWRRVSFTKGCYPGQEVVARVNTYGESPRQLCRLRFDSGTRPLRGCELVDDEGKRLGVVSSWVYSPLHDAPLGLGTLRRAAAQTGARLWAVAGEERVGVTVELPEKVAG